MWGRPHIHGHTKPHADTTVANESRPNFVICINFWADLISPEFRQNPRFFFWEETKESSVEIASLSYSGAFSFFRWCNRRLWATPFAFLVPHQGTNWLGGLDPRRWRRSCASTLQITKFLPETSLNWQMWSIWLEQRLVNNFCSGHDQMKKENRNVWCLECATMLQLQN